jgi:hypothetical protein
MTYHIAYESFYILNRFTMPYFRWLWSKKFNLELHINVYDEKYKLSLAKQITLL